MSKRTRGICLFLTVFLFVSSAVFAGPDMPDKIKNEFTQYPGSAVMNTMQSPIMTQVILDCGSEPLDRVYDYYKKKATANGWTVQMENKSADVYNLMLKKGEHGGMITVGGEKGQISATLSVMSQK
jgi:hypothetical protein